jgi:DNA-binding IclR family transcriptional regulator
MTAEELAPSTATDAPSLHRMMRTLASLGLLKEDPGHRFSLRSLGEALKTPAWSAVKNYIRPAPIKSKGAIQEFLYSSRNFSGDG